MATQQLQNERLSEVAEYALLAGVGRKFLWHREQGGVDDVAGSASGLEFSIHAHEGVSAGAVNVAGFHKPAVVAGILTNKGSDPVADKIVRIEEHDVARI